LRQQRSFHKTDDLNAIGCWGASNEYRLTTPSQLFLDWLLSSEQSAQPCGSNGSPAGARSAPLAGSNAART
jgi:hypothetical protein